MRYKEGIDKDSIEGNTTYLPIEQDQEVQFGELKVYCMNSFEEEVMDVNQNSLVLRLQMDEVSFMITGDITDATIARMVEDYKADDPIWKVNILQIPHHGYYSGIPNTTLYELTDADFAFVDCSASEYEQNAVGIKEQLKLIEDMGISIIKRFLGPNEVKIS